MSYTPDPSLPHPQLSDIDEEFELLDVSETKHDPNPKTSKSKSIGRGTVTGSDASNEPETKTRIETKMEIKNNNTPMTDTNTKSKSRTHLPNLNYYEPTPRPSPSSEIIHENTFPVIDYTIPIPIPNPHNETNNDPQIPLLEESYLERLRSLKADTKTQTTPTTTTETNEPKPEYDFEFGTHTTPDPTQIFSPSPHPRTASTNFTYHPFFGTPPNIASSIPNQGGNWPGAGPGLPPRPDRPFRFRGGNHHGMTFEAADEFPSVNSPSKANSTNPTPDPFQGNEPLLKSLNPTETLNETFTKLAHYFTIFPEEPLERRTLIVRELVTALSLISKRTEAGELDFGDVTAGEKVMVVVRVLALRLGLGEWERGLEVREREVKMKMKMKMEGEVEVEGEVKRLEEELGKAKKTIEGLRKENRWLVWERGN
ncbi:uncharacterized protein BO80DRAFT_487692 [Aspergillus ibericus CBS 121593]|uniref:Uncharacterized protein n=1 Tax=Aspergillus ibericus CBS 121593 TaxID=1448316 RepID=A0A395H8P4_9EURO|nr:hypothetical protein BO80DRAFT_487692 [Aspergillus ibericus CBS 121593]RAL03893.1 hypothetical protein BO80DRAFT_487692 [Aspergillus ibericus CBS 121593]